MGNGMGSGNVDTRAASAAVVRKIGTMNRRGFQALAGVRTDVSGIVAPVAFLLP
jgi:hypothetical protein